MEVQELWVIPPCPGTAKHWTRVSGTKHENKANLRSQPNEVILLIYFFKHQGVNYWSSNKLRLCGQPGHFTSLVSLLNKHGKVLGGRGHQFISPRQSTRPGSLTAAGLAVLRAGPRALTSPRSTPPTAARKNKSAWREIKKKPHHTNTQ